MAEAVGFEPTCPCGQLHFECSSLQPLRYASVYKYSLLGTNHMISSRSRYDLFDSPPYISTVFRALRKCKKNTQEQYEILKFDPAKTLINQGFSAEKTARANAHFESFPPCDFWWKLSEDGSTQRKPKSCGILRISASVFRFYLNPRDFPSSSHFYPKL